MRRLVLSSLTAVAVLLSVPALAQDTDWKRGPLGRLSPLIGTEKVERVLADPGVLKAMADMMPANMVARAKANMQVRGPIDFIDGWIALRGNAPHRGDTDTADVWVRPYDGRVIAAVRVDGKLTIYANEVKYEYLPLEFRNRVMFRDDSALKNPPPGAVWNRNAGG